MSLVIQIEIKVANFALNTRFPPTFFSFFLKIRCNLFLFFQVVFKLYICMEKTIANVLCISAVYLNINHFLKYLECSYP